MDFFKSLKYTWAEWWTHTMYRLITSFKEKIHHYFTMQVNTVKPAHVVTSIKQSPVLKGHIFLILS
jgi:hypothetical protein